MNFSPNISHTNQFPLHHDNKIFMNVFSMNIQSLRNKLNDFSIFVQQNPLKFHVIVLSETHLRQNELSNFNLPGYAAEHCVRESGRFGGVSIFVRKDFSPFNLIHKLDVEMNNSLLIKLLNFDIHIAAFYHYRDSIFDNFLDRLDFVLDNYSNCYVLAISTSTCANCAPIVKSKHIMTSSKQTVSSF
jgi:hypothetical protein